MTRTPCQGRKYYENLLKATEGEKLEKPDMSQSTWFNLNGADKAITKMTHDKALGPNGFGIVFLTIKST